MSYEVYMYVDNSCFSPKTSKILMYQTIVLYTLADTLLLAKYTTKYTMDMCGM